MSHIDHSFILLHAYKDTDFFFLNNLFTETTGEVNKLQQGMTKSKLQKNVRL